MAVNGKVKENNQPKVNFFSRLGNNIIQFFKELKAEAKRITWASQKDVKKAIAAVVTFVVIYVVVVGVLDFGFNKFFNLIFK